MISPFHAPLLLLLLLYGRAPLIVVRNMESRRQMSIGLGRQFCIIYYRMYIVQCTLYCGCEHCSMNNKFDLIMHWSDHCWYTLALGLFLSPDVHCKTYTNEQFSQIPKKVSPQMLLRFQWKINEIGLFWNCRMHRHCHSWVFLFLCAIFFYSTLAIVSIELRSMNSFTRWTREKNERKTNNRIQNDSSMKSVGAIVGRIQRIMWPEKNKQTKRINRK